MTDAIGTDVPPAVEGADAASAAGGETFTVTKNVLVGSLVGSGVQFNQNTFAAGLGEEKSFKQLEGKIMRLKPQFVRLFYNDAQATKPGEDHRPKRFPWTGTTQASFLRAVKLAQRTGATINVTWQAGPEIFTDPATHLTSHMSRFADVLETLVTTLGLPSLWVTIQNEPNDARNKNITPRKLQDAYVKLDELLIAKGLRPKPPARRPKKILFMGGDLIAEKQDLWFDYMAEHMAGLLDAYSVHIYWNYWELSKLEQRLKSVSIRNQLPLFVTEYGVRGTGRGKGGVGGLERRDPGWWFPGPVDPKTGVPHDVTKGGVHVEETTTVAFQHAWFLIRAAHYGFAGTVKWDCHPGPYDNSAQAYYAIGPPPDWRLTPTYFLLRLVVHTIPAGWRVLEVTGQKSDAKLKTPTNKQLAAFAGPGDPPAEMTVLGLNKLGAGLGAPTKEKCNYSIGGLTKGKVYNHYQWNHGGRGGLASFGKVTAGPTGVAEVKGVPLHAVFALTARTLPR